jgi:hypothetical protein
MNIWEEWEERDGREQEIYDAVTDPHILAMLDVLAPRRGPREPRIPIFEWGHETTPTPDEMIDLARDLLAAPGQGLAIRALAARDAELKQLRAAAERVRALCADVQDEAEGGGTADVDTLWPSQVLRALHGDEAD